MLQIAVCDDTVPDRRAISFILKQYFNTYPYDYNIVEYSSGETLTDDYEEGKYRFGLIFLDIYLTGMLGIEAARKIRRYDKKTAIIFMTTTPEYALESYDVRAYGYLVKPLKADRVMFLMNSYLKEECDLHKKAFFFKEGRNRMKVAFGEIEYIESQRNVLLINLVSKEQHRVYMKMDQAEEELKKYGFLRCHQSFIVNMNYVRRADKDFIMDSGARVPIRQRNVKIIRNFYFEYILEKSELTRI